MALKNYTSTVSAAKSIAFIGKMNSCLVKFLDNDEQLNCSRNALRKVEG